jgi:hypothetical protein
MKVKSLIASAFIALLAVAPASAQQMRNCGTTEYHQHQLDMDPSLAGRQADIETFTKKYVETHTGQEKAIVTIPVVFHVLYSASAQNISDALIYAQLDQLNKDYARLNSDAGNTPAAFQGLAANTQIQFCLAQRDPNGAATTGIVRKSTTVTSFSSNNAVKYSAQGGDNAWDAAKYLNIWSCNLGGGLLGYAQFPGGAAATDGVVALYSSIGSLSVPGTASPYNYGRTMTHEVGHWLNLRHIWGDANCGNDLVSDTPTQQTSNYGCPTFPHKTCSNTTNGDMFMNYMDYTDDACMNMFSTGQSARMAALFATGGARVGLTTSLGCSPVSQTGCGTPSGLAASSITSSTATISWTAVSGATSYNVQFRVVGATTWTTGTVTTASASLSGLTASSNYEWQVQANCNGTLSAFASGTFTTLAAGGTTCTDTYESNETRTTGKTIAVNTDISAKIGTATDKDYFKFTTTTSAKNIKVVLDNLPADYDIRLYNSSGTQLAISQNGGTTAETIIRNTSSAATYYVQVYGYNGAFNASTCYRLRVNASSTSFKTMSGADEDVAIDVEPVDALALYPNPTTGNFTVSLLSDNENDALVRVFDITGKAVNNTRFAATKGQNLFNVDLSGNAHGIYFVEVNQGATRLVKKLIVE